MATELIAAGTAAAASADFTVSEGEEATVFIGSSAGVPSTSRALIEIKSSTGYTRAGRLDKRRPAGVINAPGEYRARRIAGTASFAVYRS